MQWLQLIVLLLKLRQLIHDWRNGKAIPEHDKKRLRRRLAHMAAILAEAKAAGIEPDADPGLGDDPYEDGSDPPEEDAGGGTNDIPIQCR